MICSLMNSKKVLISSILVILIIGSLTLIAYNNQNDALQNSVKMGLESTASVMATQISPKDLDGLKPGDEESEQYTAIARKLQNMRSMDDNILNAYILKVNSDQTVTFLVDDLYPDDPQGSAKIGEVSTAPDKMDILLALSGPTTSKQPYTTRYGSFMTAYAPIDDSIQDSTGNTYAVLAIDVSAVDYTDYTSRGGMILLTGFISMILAIGGIFYFSGSRRDEKK
jgi:methyl-accepting chemotaxis protein